MTGAVRGAASRTGCSTTCSGGAASMSTGADSTAGGVSVTGSARVSMRALLRDGLFDNLRRECGLGDYRSRFRDGQVFGFWIGLFRVRDRRGFRQLAQVRGRFDDGVSQQQLGGRWRFKHLLGDRSDWEFLSDREVSISGSSTGPLLRGATAERWPAWWRFYTGAVSSTGAVGSVIG